MSASRREFAKRFVIAAVAAPLLDSTPIVAQPPQAQPEPPSGSSNIRKIEQDLDRLSRYMQRMREHELHNWDEPDTIFFALGGDE